MRRGERLLAVVILFGLVALVMSFQHSLSPHIIIVPASFESKLNIIKQVAAVPDSVPAGSSPVSGNFISLKLGGIPNVNIMKNMVSQF
jgi:hypothetical protein